MTMTHIYRPRWFQWTWFVVIWPSGCWVTVSARFQEHFIHLWVDPCSPDGQMARTLHIYRPRQFQWTWFGMNRPSGSWVTVFTRFQECFIHPWAHPCGLNAKMTKALHIYRPKRLQWTWFGVNPPSSCWVPASIRFQEPLLHQWTHTYGPDGRMTMVLHI